MVDYGPNGSANRFVCPSDRQLALRAKLKTGWSVKTGSMGYGSSQEHTGNGDGDQAQASAPNATMVRQPLAPEEQEQILDVIRRAEALDLREQERVGRLVARLENMKRNMKNALGRLPNQCLLCAEHFGLLGAQSVRCIYCRKLVCQKCAIENYEANAHRRNEWLCKICAETREMWKKSGAWFYNQIPRYILPGQKTTGPGDRSRSSPALDDSSSSEDERRIAAMTRRSRRNSKDGAEERVHTPTPQESYSRQTSSSESRSSGKEPGTSGLGQNSLETIDGLDETHGSIAGSRRGSTASRSLSEWTWSEDKTSPSVSSVVSSGIGGTKISDDHSPKHLDPNTPTISLTLSYDPLTDTLHVLVHRAKNLPPMDINGLADPFCKLDIVPEGKICRRLRTKTVHKTRNPEFDESLTFYEITEMDLLKKSLHVLVLDDDKYGKDYMGEAKLSLAGLKVQRSLSITLSLEKQLNGDCCGPVDLSSDHCTRGQILISLCYSTRRRALLVTIVRCSNLLPMDNNGFSDPFVKLHLQPHHRKYKTTIKWKNLNPTFNEEFPFETRPDELSTKSLYISVWDKDYGKSNDYLGGLIIGGVGSKGRRLKHWLDMIHYPDHRHECWHNLIEDQLPD